MLYVLTQSDVDSCTIKWQAHEAWSIFASPASHVPFILRTLAAVERKSGFSGSALVHQPLSLGKTTPW